MSVQAEIGILDHVDGSSEFVSQDTKVICSVTGPIEPKARQELPTQLALEIIVRPAKGVATTREKVLEDKLRAVLTPLITRYCYPRQLCQITCQILESGEDEAEFSLRELSCCINAAFLALVDAGIALNSMCASIPIAIIKDTSDIIVDPTAEQLKISLSVHTLALEFVNGGKVVKNVLLLDSNGDFNEDQLFSLLELGEQKCQELVTNIRRIIQDNISPRLVV
ncbi:CRB_1a_G0020910.mRNA.1.CDS.1 [Saccharomyces cerevisiae]|nr:CRB_1a_G0020910.mRNA.1.CDS.1 [Saccharomyces cerevisiae]CAI7306968.1 CRB_1a_G0020910.mRNA.1.CDS.1 [Saccharomyces cerevisiae]